MLVAQTFLIADEPSKGSLPLCKYYHSAACAVRHALHLALYMLKRRGRNTQRLAAACSNMLGPAAAARAYKGFVPSLGEHRSAQLTLPHLARTTAATSVASWQPGGCGSLPAACASRACRALHAVASTALPSEAAHAVRDAAHAGAQPSPFADAEARSAYLHSPWCKNKCHYCDFPVVAVGATGVDRPAVQTRMQDYVDLLLAEMHAAPHTKQLDKVCCRAPDQDVSACTACTVMFVGCQAPKASHNPLALLSVAVSLGCSRCRRCFSAVARRR